MQIKTNSEDNQCPSLSSSSAQRGSAVCVPLAGRLRERNVSCSVRTGQTGSAASTAA